MNILAYELSLCITALAVLLLARRPFRGRLTEHMIFFAAGVFAFSALVVESSDEFWRLMTASLVAIGFGLEISSVPWTGRARLRLALILPIMIFTGSVALSSPLLSGALVSHLSISLIVLAILSDIPMMSREKVEETSAHPLRALRVLIIGVLGAFYVQNFLPTSIPAEDIYNWRSTLTGIGGFLMLMSFFTRNPRKRQMLVAAWLGLLSFWGVLSQVKSLALAGVLVAATAALALVFAGDEAINLRDLRQKVLKFGLSGLPGTFLFSAFALFLINRQDGDGSQLAVWIFSLCLNWFAVARDSWDWEKVKEEWTLRHRIALFVVIAGSSLLLLAPQLSALVELLQ
jgi:hypothetical protein